MKKIAVITGASSGIGREYAIQIDKNEVFDQIWLIARREDKLNEVATNPHAHFDPMYELRYVVGRAVSDAVYNQDVPLSEKVDKMSELNDNVKSLNGIQISQQQSPIDAITTHLGVENIETLVDNYAQKMTQNRENQQLRQ